MSAPATTTLKQELLRVEKQTWEAWKARDAAALDAVFDDDFVMIMEDGITEQRRPDFVKMMLDSDFRLKSYKLDEARVTARELAPGVAFIAYKARSETVRKGETRADDYFFGSTFVKKGGRWVAAVNSVSRAA